MSVYPSKCYKCYARLPKGRKNAKCTDCNRDYMRHYMRRVQAEIVAKRERQFPGVDIDAIHFKRGAVKR